VIVKVVGDITTTDCKVIAHGVNCQNVMGSGVARALFEKWPQVKGLYHSWFEEFNAGPKGERALGQVDDLQLKDGKVIVNCFTQQFFGAGDRRYLSYDALVSCMSKLYMICEYYKVNEVAIPKIGCGLAGGSWDITKAILNDAFPPDFQIKVYVLDKDDEV
jgi:O-acetyl-ADP-ribose deacetylase (regulator of RNase III)